MACRIDIYVYYMVQHGKKYVFVRIQNPSSTTVDTAKWKLHNGTGRTVTWTIAPKAAWPYDPPPPDLQPDDVEIKSGELKGVADTYPYTVFIRVERTYSTADHVAIDPDIVIDDPDELGEAITKMIEDNNANEKLDEDEEDQTSAE